MRVLNIPSKLISLFQAVAALGGMSYWTSLMGIKTPLAKLALIVIFLFLIKPSLNAGTDLKDLGKLIEWDRYSYKTHPARSELTQKVGKEIDLLLITRDPTTKELTTYPDGTREVEEYDANEKLIKETITDFDGRREAAVTFPH